MFVVTVIAAEPTSLPYIAALLPPEHEALSYLKEEEVRDNAYSKVKVFVLCSYNLFINITFYLIIFCF